jgi:hypothetical protein
MTKAKPIAIYSIPQLQGLFFRAKKIHIEHEQLNRVGKCRKDLSKHVSARMPTARGAMPREPRKNQGKSNRQATDKSKRQQQGIRV